MKPNRAAVYILVDSLGDVHYKVHMIETQQTKHFAEWFSALRDNRAVKKIAVRIAMLQAGHFGDVKSVGDKVAELRIDYGPGYRLYFTRRGEELILLLIGGDKSSQARDIAKAKELAAGLD